VGSMLRDTVKQDPGCSPTSTGVGGGGQPVVEEDLSPHCTTTLASHPWHHVAPGSTARGRSGVLLGVGQDRGEESPQGAEAGAWKGAARRGRDHLWTRP
jgi:hypothetical protein